MSDEESGRPGSPESVGKASPEKRSESDAESKHSSDGGSPKAKKTKSTESNNGRSYRKHGSRDDSRSRSRSRSQSRSRSRTRSSSRSRSPARSPRREREHSPQEKGHELFIGQLPYSCEEHEVKKFFKKHGFKPLEVRMPRDKITQQPRGFAFVLFGTAREVEEATELNGTNMGGRQLRINHANEKPIPGRGGRPERFGGRGYGGRSDRGRAASSPSKTLFIRNLSYDTTEDTLLKLFRSAHNVSLPTTGDGSLKGFGFIDFDDEEEAEYALRKMDGKRVNGREIRLEYKRGGGGDRERSSYSYDSRRGRDYDRDRSREYDRDRDRGGNRYY